MICMRMQTSKEAKLSKLKSVPFQGFPQRGGMGGDPPLGKNFDRIPPHKIRNPPPLNFQNSGGGIPPTSAGAKRRKNF